MTWSKLSQSYRRWMAQLCISGSFEPSTLPGQFRISPHVRSHSSSTSRGGRIWRYLVFAWCLSLALPLFAIRGVFQGRVVEGTKREAGKYIYIAGRSGYLRRVNIENCRVRFDSGVPASQRVRSASEYLRDDAEVRITADQAQNGEWVAIEVLILKLPALDKARFVT